MWRMASQARRTCPSSESFHGFTHLALVHSLFIWYVLTIIFRMLCEWTFRVDISTVARFAPLHRTNTQVANFCTGLCRCHCSQSLLIDWQPDITLRIVYSFQIVFYAVDQCRTDWLKFVSLWNTSSVLPLIYLLRLPCTSTLLHS